MPNRAELHILTEYTPFSMGFVIITKNNRAIVIDGGTGGELHNVIAHVGDRPIAAWILTHPHGDHLGALLYGMQREKPILKQVNRFICNFHTPAFLRACGGDEAANVEYFDQYVESHQIPVDRPVCGDRWEIDGLQFECLFSKSEKYTENYVNDSSMVFRVTGENRNVLFLGDLGPAAGEELLATQGNNLRSDIVQMAHHGHMCVRKNVYEAINPGVCIWCCASWLYNERDVEFSKDMYGVGTTRRWMREIGNQTHIVTKDGDQILEI